MKMSLKMGKKNFDVMKKSIFLWETYNVPAITFYLTEIIHLT